MKKEWTETQMKKRIEAYFASRRVAVRTDSGEILRNKGGEIVYEEKMPTITGLALALECTAREDLYDYTEEKEKALVSRALLRIEESAEEKLFSKDTFTGTRLFLETNFPRWRGEEGSNSSSDMPEFFSNWSR